METFEKRILSATALIRSGVRITAFSGAGISTESGISDFRSPGGVWDRYRTVTYQEFISSHEARIEYWSMKRDLFEELRNARPNRAHIALAELEKMGKLSCLVTQNIDGLHQDAGNSAEKVVEIHGTNRKAICLSCAGKWSMEEIYERLKSGDLDPKCNDCGGLIKPATVSFGQAMPEAELQRAFDCAVACDVFLMIGSSLQVEPAASVPHVAHNSGAKLVFVNRTETPLDHIAEVRFSENAGDVLHGIVDALKSNKKTH